jgi:hypothetical protein
MNQKIIKPVLWVSLLVLIGFFAGCNSTNNILFKKPTKQDIAVDSTKQDIPVVYMKKIMENYSSNYQNQLNDHSRALYTGLNIHFVNYERRLVYGQDYFDQISLYFTPTIIKTSDPNDFMAFKKYFEGPGSGKFDKEKINHGAICPGNCDSTTSTWGHNQKIRNLQTIGEGKDDLIFATSENAAKYKDNYEATYAMFNRVHTNSIYFKKDVIDILLKESSGSPAFAFYFAAYNESKKAPGQAKKNQITMVICPLKIKDGKYEPDLVAYNKFVEKYTYNNGAPVNHGELCPNNCPPEGQ